jgi:hypothetical protein
MIRTKGLVPDGRKNTRPFSQRRKELESHGTKSHLSPTPFLPLRAQDIEEALALANHSRYALTSGLYSRSPANIERVKREFHVGNLYINRWKGSRLAGLN